ncbi:dynein regulatory complex subunit 7 isoform X3 [Hippoglossus stenolepis]|uniref:dynein regulatory complex subunit 7 isoform X3 n=1 Tax=Hippoglossus stenolepis TaxID=195615 RepID=UPI001FB02437|nr:dynein regulatory complex subunit 7 isoform X3 [Hippoglossus stenolepis]
MEQKTADFRETMETVLESEEDEGRELEKTFRNTQVSVPRQLLLSLNMADSSCPESHRINSAAQIRLLTFANNFQRQFSHMYPDRRPLLLFPTNECGVQFVSTTLRATATVQPELFTWEGCAEFAASFLSLEPLDSPIDLPSYLFSPASVLKTQRATCFEFATLLCSLLLGVNYDAYCVSGYADKEMCLLDQSLQDCPLLDTPVQSVISEESQENKYKEKPQRSLKSHFMTQEEQKKKPSAEAALLENLKPDEQGEQRPVDRLRGLRLHCWVLVLSGSRSVQENFFIDPLTGISYGTAAAGFLGIESVWNNHNYYVNMQDCRSGCSDMVYDLEDVNMWEPLLFGATSKKQLIHEALNKNLYKMTQDVQEELEELEEQAFEMPRSWVSDVSITKKDLETRWPGGHKLTRYRKAELERFAPYLRPNGLITRLVSYKDLDCTEVLLVKEWYQHRTDHLEEREVNKVDNATTERFKRGRRFDLLFHRYESLTTDGAHEMKFSSIRVDNLVQRLVSPGEMTETFERRADSLYYRRVNFGRHVQFSEEHVNSEPATRLLQVVERFHRNSSKPANEDVAERVFLLAQRRIEVTYHLDADTFIPSHRSFIKPREATEQKKAEDFTQDMVSSFMVGLSDTPVKTLILYEMLVSLMKDEEMVVHQIEESLKEVRDIVSCREEEEGDIQLFFSPWTTTGAARARSKRQEMERQAAEEQSWLHENEKDILAPLLMRLDITDPLSADDAKELHQECLSEFKQKLVEDANLIQERYQNETQELQKKQQWYHQNQLDMTEQQEDEYQTYCSDRTLQIRVAMRRLKMHQEEAPLKYQALDERLREDPRLAPHLLS